MKAKRMAIPKAVASSVKTPGLYLVVNLLGTPAAPGTSPLRALIMAPKSAAGNITPDTEVRRCNGPTDASAAVGPGTQGHLTAIRLFQRFGLASVDIIAPAASEGAVATATQTFTGPATQSSTIRFRVSGRIIDVPWLAGESVAVFQARAVLAIGAQGNNLPVTVGGASPDLVYTAKVPGPWGNDIRISATIFGGGGGIAVTANPATLTGGETEPSFAVAFSQVSTREYARIIPCLSNADATDATSGSNGERLGGHIDSLESGGEALLQVGLVGHTGTLANVKAGAIDRNNEAIEYAYGQNWNDLPCEIAGAEAGDAMRCIGIRPNFNRIGNVHSLYGPTDLVADKLTAAEKEDLLNNGVTPLDVDQLTGVTYLVRPITTHSTAGPAPDFRAFDLSDTDGMYAVFRDLRAVLPQEFPNCSVSPDLPPGSDPLPAGVVELKDIRQYVLSRLRFWTRQGVVNKAALDLAIENDEVIFEIDEADGSQVNIFLPLSILKPLAKMGVVGSKVA
jgi:phage tail sheath gpL-like